MPALDLTFLLSDPDLCEPFTVVRQQQTMNATTGRAVVTETQLQALGSIQPKDTAIGGNVIEQGADASFRAAVLTVHTAFHLRSVTENSSGVVYLPDQVIFNGDRYLVTLTNDYTHFGGGFVQAELTSLPIQDAPP